MMLRLFRSYITVGIQLMIMCDVLAGKSLENDCSISASNDQHSDWYPVRQEGQDFHAWQVYTTTGNASNLAVYWERFPSPLDCSVHSNSTIIVNPQTINVTITVNDTRVGRACSDEGFYRVIVKSNCGNNAEIKFHLNFVGHCTLTPPNPAEPKMVVVPEPQPGDPTTLCTTMRYFGSADNNDYDARWYLGNGNCTDPPLCADDDDDDGDCEHGCFKCNRTHVSNCTFISNFYIRNYSKFQSGNYTTHSCPGISGTGSGNITSTVDLRILGWPHLTQWPGSTLTSALNGEGARLTYQLSNFTPEFLNLTFYKGSELIANVSTEGYELDVVCDDAKCEMATIQWQVPAEGLYHMCYNFSSVVMQNVCPQNYDFPPTYDFPPNCTEVTRVAANELLVETLVPVAIIILVMVVCVIVCVCVCVKFRPKKKSVQSEGTHTHISEDLHQNEQTPLLVGRQQDYGTSSSSGTTPDLEELHEAYDIASEAHHPGSLPKLKLADDLDRNGDTTQTDAPNYGTGLKVFILSPHNPNEYIHILPPAVLQQHPEQNEDLMKAYETELEENKARMTKEIAEHEGLITRFANCLKARGVTATGVHQLRDRAVSNVVQWADEQIKNSNFVILVITSSFSEFLDNPPPPEDEYLFGATGGYVSRLLHNPPEGVTFLPVFLNQFKDMNLLPITLRGTPLYEIFEPFENSLEQLYTVLTSSVTKSV